MQIKSILVVQSAASAFVAFVPDQKPEHMQIRQVIRGTSTLQARRRRHRHRSQLRHRHRSRAGVRSTPHGFPHLGCVRQHHRRKWRPPLVSCSPISRTPARHGLFRVRLVTRPCAKFIYRQQTHHPFNRSPHNRREHTTASTVPADSPFGIDLVQLPQFDSHRANNSRKGRVFCRPRPRETNWSNCLFISLFEHPISERFLQLSSPQYPDSPIKPRPWRNERARREGNPSRGR